jgi:hypothetical protein
MDQGTLNQGEMGTSTRASLEEADAATRPEPPPCVHGSATCECGRWPAPRVPVSVVASPQVPLTSRAWPRARVIVCVLSAIVSMVSGYLQWTWAHASVVAERGITQLIGDLTTTTAEPLRDFLLHVACSHVNRPVKINVVPRGPLMWRFEIEKPACSEMTVERLSGAPDARIEVVFVGSAPQPLIRFVGNLRWIGGFEPFTWEDGVILWLHDNDDIVYGTELAPKPKFTTLTGATTNSLITNALTPATPSSGRVYQWLDSNTTCRERDSRGRDRKCAPLQWTWAHAGDIQVDLRNIP